MTKSLIEELCVFLCISIKTKKGFHNLKKPFLPKYIKDILSLLLFSYE